MMNENGTQIFMIYMIFLSAFASLFLCIESFSVGER